MRVNNDIFAEADVIFLILLGMHFVSFSLTKIVNKKMIVVTSQVER